MKKSILNNEKGMAVIETIPLIMVFVFLICYELGMFGVIHTGIMQSISARAYAFETFKNRSNLVYFRDGPGQDSNHYFRVVGNRTHGIASEKHSDADGQRDGIGAERPLRIGIPYDVSVSDSDEQSSRENTTLHNKTIFEKITPGKRIQLSDKYGVSPVLIQVQYGMCLNVSCGDT